MDLELNKSKCHPHVFSRPRLASIFTPPQSPILSIHPIFGLLSASRSPENSTSALCVPRARRYAYEKICDWLFKFFSPNLGIEERNKEPEFGGKFPQRPLKESIGILYDYGPGVRGTNAQHFPSLIWEHSHLCQYFFFWVKNDTWNGWSGTGCRPISE